MRLTIHKVGLGLCVTLIHDNGNVMVWDCGHDDEFRPSTYLTNLGISEVQRLFITNFDQDHVSDLPNMRASLNIRSLYKNPTITTDALRQLKLKSGPITNAMESTLDMLGTYTGPPSDYNFPNVDFRTFYNSYGGQFLDTNNISLVTFLSCNGTNFLITGDVEVAGWNGLLENTSIGDILPKVDVFLASHHGRLNGYHPGVMSIALPDVVVMSDSPVLYATQETVEKYRQHCTGINFNDTSRRVLTTRSDGSLTWTL